MSSIKKKILVIEDHNSIRLLLERFLSKRYDVTCKSDGFDGLAWLSYGNIPDLIILDMSMPRLSGIDFLNNIRTSGLFRDIPVLVVSADDDSKVIKKCYELGIKGYISKPFNPINLNDTINTVFSATFN
jgi:two-component system chemotaxis response regulator CheY